MKIGIADDHELFRMGLKLLLQSIEGCEVVVEANSGNALLLEMGEQSLDLVVLDYSMPDGSGLDVLAQLKALPATPKAILLTATATNLVLQQALDLGASALVAKAGDGAEVVSALDAIAQGRQYISSDFDALLQLRSQLDSLTAREREVLLKLLAGHSTRQVAEQLSVSFKTAETHRTRLMQKLDIHSFAELMQFAHSSGLLPDS